MRYVNGLYMTLTLMMFIIIVNTNIFDGEYSGIALYLCLGLFIVGTAFFIGAKLSNLPDDDK